MPHDKAVMRGSGVAQVYLSLMNHAPCLVLFEVGNLSCCHQRQVVRLTLWASIAAQRLCKVEGNNIFQPPMALSARADLGASYKRQPPGARQ